MCVCVCVKEWRRATGDGMEGSWREAAGVAATRREGEGGGEGWAGAEEGGGRSMNQWGRHESGSMEGAHTQQTLCGRSEVPFSLGTARQRGWSDAGV
jgi:hypothetical protein